MILNKVKKEEYEAYGYTEDDVIEIVSKISYMNNDLFRYVFGSGDAKSKRILRAMTSYIVKREVVDVTIDNCEPVKERRKEKGIRLDLLVHALDDGGNTRVINLEMQNYGTSESNSMRLQAYIAKLISQQIKQGSSDYQFKETYQVMFCNRLYSIDDDRYYHGYRYVNVNVD